MKADATGPVLAVSGGELNNLFMNSVNNSDGYSMLTTAVSVTNLVKIGIHGFFAGDYVTYFANGATPFPETGLVEGATYKVVSTGMAAGAYIPTGNTS